MVDLSACLLKPMDWTPAFAGETNLRHRPFSSFRRKPESSGVMEEFDVNTITALSVNMGCFLHVIIYLQVHLVQSFQRRNRESTICV